MAALLELVHISHCIGVLYMYMLIGWAANMFIWLVTIQCTVIRLGGSTTYSKEPTVRLEG